MTVLQSIQLWKTQPILASAIGSETGWAVLTKYWSGSLVLRASSGSHDTGSSQFKYLSNSSGADPGGSGRGSNDKSGPSSQPSFWASTQKIIFPVGQKAAQENAPRKPFLSNHAGVGDTARPSAPAGGTASQAAASSAFRAERRPSFEARRTGRIRDDAFAPLSKPAEQLSGTLLKAAVVLITIPIAVHMLSRTLLMSLCVRGLEAERPETVVLTLRRIRSVVVSEFLAARFEGEDGVGSMMTLFRQGTPDAVLREFLRTAEYLLKFESTRDALLMSSLVERLERAQAAGWLSPELKAEAEQLYLDAHAARRMAVEGAAAS